MSIFKDNDNISSLHYHSSFFPNGKKKQSVPISSLNMIHLIILFLAMQQPLRTQMLSVFILFKVSDGVI